MTDDALLSLREVAAELSISTKTLQRHVDEGRIAYIQVGGGRLRRRIAFARADIDAFRDRQRRFEVQHVDNPSIYRSRQRVIKLTLEDARNGHPLRGHRRRTIPLSERLAAKD